MIPDAWLRLADIIKEKRDGWESAAEILAILVVDAAADPSWESVLVLARRLGDVVSSALEGDDSMRKILDVADRLKRALS